MDQIKKNWNTIKGTQLELKDFALVVGTVFVLIGLIKNGYRIHLFVNNFLLWGIIILIIGIIRPMLLKYAHKAWMTFGLTMGIVMNFLLLFIIYVTVFIPIGLILKILGKELMDKPNRNAKSYWSIRSEQVRRQEYYKKQF